MYLEMPFGDGLRIPSVATPFFPVEVVNTVMGIESGLQHSTKLGSYQAGKFVNHDIIPFLRQLCACV